MATNEIYTGQVAWQGASYEVQFAHYPNGRTAIVLLGIDDPTDNARATVNVPELPIDLDQVLIKDIDENEDMVAALVAAGVVTDLGRDVPVNRYHLRLCRLQRLEVNVAGLQVQWDGVGHMVTVVRQLDGWPALVLRHPVAGRPDVRATVHVPCVPLQPGQVMVRYLHLLAALVGAGVVADTGKSTEVHGVLLHVVTLGPAARQAAARAGCDI